MPFAMTHLIIAKKISDKYSGCVKSLPQFYLGSIAPDAVHNRVNYVSDYKKHSHLITGTEKWGMTTENDKWKNNVLEFLYKHKNSNNRDFVLGYCVHVLTDLNNNIVLWTPFREQYFKERDWEYDNIHHRESEKIDIELALSYDERHIFWENLKMSNSVDLPDYVYASEIDNQKNLILNEWYINKERPDVSLNEVRTYTLEMEFIKNTADYIDAIFKSSIVID